ncbi:MAG TPA: Zn-ribbon domain-containing OB-fold protein [Brevefilum fermentans]|jgi:uncharacterized OB-fold protein|uniref:Protein containing DUF35 n=1 Tax=Candidatus Brevifilum fermentans TaxID=1986204 RepID=A0A1Y6K3W3_9CHLR|nr:Zn-ribbon domain-containing OB-fold protein [Brevefilum fermentans]SMX54375.1 Protein containing DUF35 [Brevefilum fermentans]HQA28858.1 Zn-ribbon domain-containing OB-fold protein [Brevefilum fermentans]
MEAYSMNSQDFFEALEAGVLIGSHCLDCGTKSIPQRQICPKCLGSRTEIVEYSGKGFLAAFTVVYVPSSMMANNGFDSKNPYCVGIVELDEGPKISAQILDVDLSNPESISIGTKLVMASAKNNAGENQKPHLAFRPV